MAKLDNLKIALAHDFLVQKGGAEKVLQVFAEMFPEAPIFTALYDPERMGDFLVGREIKTSFLQKMPKFLRKRYQWLAPLFPVAWETLDFRDYDVVLSSSGAWSKGIVTKLKTVHVAYLHSPMRFVWDYNDKYLRELGKGKMSLLARAYFSYLRLWDREAAQRPEVLLANSEYTKKRIEKYYRRESEVVYPPVTNLQLITDNSQQNQEIQTGKLEKPQRGHSWLKTKSYFLIISRLSAYKRIDVAIQAFNKLELPLVVIGEGPEFSKLQKMAGKKIKLLGWQTDAVVADYLANARALVNVSEEDFGLGMAEALAAGVPVLAYGAGGALEIVKEGVTGEFFAAQQPEILAECALRFLAKEKNYDQALMRLAVEKISRAEFERQILAILEKSL